MLFDGLQQLGLRLLLWGVVVTILTLVFLGLRESWKIRKLGGRAVKIPSYAIFFGMSEPGFHSNSLSVLYCAANKHGS